MKVQGNFISFPKSGEVNDTLPPLLDNFKANKGKAETVDFPNVPVGSTILLGKYKGKPIRWKVIDGMAGFASRAGERGANYLRIYDRNLISPRLYKKEPIKNPEIDGGASDSYRKSDLCHWLNSDLKTDDIYSESGFLYEWSEEEKGCLINWSADTYLSKKIGIARNVPDGATPGWDSDPSAPEQEIFWLFGEINYSTLMQDCYSYRKSKQNPKAPATQSQYYANRPAGVEPEASIDTGAKFIFNGTDYVFEYTAETQPIVISADKMQESRATDLAGAVWVYGDHLPKNVNDGTKIELSRDEIVLPDTQYVISNNGVKVSELPLGAKIISSVKSQYHDILGRDIEWLIVDRNHEGYPANSTTLQTSNIIWCGIPDMDEGENYDKENLNYFLSNVDLWLNSDAPDGQWWHPTHDEDKAPSLEEFKKAELQEIYHVFAYAQYAGFMHMIDDPLKSAVLPSTIKSFDKKQNKLLEEERKFFLPSFDNFFDKSITAQKEDSMFALAKENYNANLKVFSTNLIERLTNNNAEWFLNENGIMTTRMVSTLILLEENSSYLVKEMYGVGFYAPCCNISSDTIVYKTATENTYSLLNSQVERQIEWDKSKDFYARQFTYNQKKQYQTMLEGATYEIKEGANV